MFAELLAQPGVGEELELRSGFGFMAYHGGSLEEGTDDIARAAAEAGGASLYAVTQPPDLRWHVPSSRVDPEASPCLARFLDHVSVVVTVHGYGREGRWTTLLLGGRNRDLATHVAAWLRPALPGYEVVDDLGRIPGELRGLHHRNPVNHPSGRGTQLELPPRVRGHGPHWRRPEAPPRSAAGRVAPTEALIVALASAAGSWPL